MAAREVVVEAGVDGPVPVGIGFKAHMNGMKPVDVPGGVVDGVIEFDGIRSAVR